MMKHSPLILILIVSLLAPALAQKKENDRVETAGDVISEILNVPENVPQSLLDRANCVIVLPSVIKFALGFGGNYGRGVMTCRRGRHFQGRWGAPSMVALEGGSFGFQLGGQATDFVLLVMNPSGAQGILSSKVKLGADAAASAGPMGRNAETATDASLRAEFLTYSRSRGLFAGISLDGSTLRPDNKANQKLYGRAVDAKDIVLKGAVHPPESAKELLSVLNKRSPENRSVN